jgi:hypothetical protein
LDAYERRVQGMQRAEIAIGYVYDGVYQSIKGVFCLGIFIFLQTPYTRANVFIFLGQD